MGKHPERDLREVMVETFIEAVAEGCNLAVLVSDSTSTAKIAPFAKAHPDRLVNVGIAEQNLVGMAAGMALGGYTAVTANAAPFLTARANEQVKNDVCYSNLNVKLVGLNAGVAYGALGSTHHSLDDVSIMRGLGNILILAPSDPVEARQVFKFALAHEGPVYIRMDSAKFPVLHDDDYVFSPGKIDVLQKGRDVAVFAMGSVAHEAVAAADELAKQGVSATVVSTPSIRPLDRDAVAEVAAGVERVVTVEEHSLHGGVGSLVSEIIAEKGLGAPVLRLGVPEGSFSVCGPRKEIRAHYDIDAKGVARRTAAFVNNARERVEA